MQTTIINGIFTLGGMILSGYGASVFTRKKYEVEVSKMKEELESASIANVEKKISVYEHIIDRLEERCKRLEQQVDDLTEKLKQANEVSEKISRNMASHKTYKHNTKHIIKKDNGTKTTQKVSEK